MTTRIETATKTEIKTVTYEVHSDVFKGFYIDIVINPAEDTTEAYLYHNSCGIKKFILGVDSPFLSEKTEEEKETAFLEMVNNELREEIKSYIDDVIKEKYL